MIGFYKLSYLIADQQIIYAISSREAYQKGFEFANKNNDTLSDVRRIEEKNLKIFDLPPINPNVNNIYYDPGSYLDAVEKFKEHIPVPVYFGYIDPSIENIQGMLLYLDINARKVGIVPKSEKMEFLDPDKHWVGFALHWVGSALDDAKIEKEPNRTYTMSSILYATIIDKEQI